MSFTPGSTFQPGDTGEQNSEAMSASAKIETYVQMVTIQPTFDALDDVPDLQKHQTDSKTTANNWINKIRITLYQNNTDLIAFASKFNTYYDGLVQYANTIEDPESRKNFVTGLNLLLKDIDSKAGNAKTAADELSSWNGLLGKDHSNFQGDLQKVESVYEGDMGVLANLKNEISSYQDAMSKDLAMIAGGAVIDVVGALMIVVGVLAEVPSGWTTTALIGGGIGVIGGGSTMIGLAAEDYQEMMEEKAKATKELANLTAEITLANNLGETLGLLGGTCGDAVKAANQLLSAWQILQTKFKTVHDDLSNMEIDIPKEWLLDELASSKEDWGKVKETAELIEQQLEGIPVEDDSKDSARLPAIAPSVRAARGVVFSRAVSATRRAIFATKTANLTVGGLDSSVYLGVRQILVSVDTTSGIVNLLVEAINLLKIDVANLSNVLKSNAAKQSASTTAQQATALIAKVEEVGTWISAQLAGVTKKSVTEVKALFAQVTAKLEEVKADILALRHGARSLARQADIAVIEWTKVIDTEKSNKTPSRTVQLATALLHLAKSLTNAVTSFATHLNNIESILQVLIISFRSVARASVDRLVGVWVHRQVPGLTTALTGLVGIKTPAPRSALARVPRGLPSSVGYLAPTPRDASLPTSLECLRGISAATAGIYGAALILVGQPNMSLDDVDQFAEQFQLARDHSAQFQSSYALDLLTPLSKAASLGSFVVIALQRIIDLANTGDFAGAVIGAQLIQQHIQDAIDTNTDSIRDFAVFLQAIRDDQSRFTVLEDSVPPALNDDIAKLSEQAAALQAQIEEDNKKIAAGATDEVLKVFLIGADLVVAIGVSFIAIPVAAGAGELVILGTKGVNAIIQGAAGAAKTKAEAELKKAIGGDDFLAQANKRIDDLRSTFISLAQQQANLALFNTVDTQVKQVVSAVAYAATQLDALSNALQRDISDFNVIIAELQASSTTSLDKALKTWQAVQAGAPRLLDAYGNYSTKITK